MSLLQNRTSKPLAAEFGEMFTLMFKPIVLAFIASAFFYVLIEQSIQNFLPTFNNKVLMLPAALSIQMSSILAGSTAIGRFLAGLVLKKFNWFYVLVGCLLLSAVLILHCIAAGKRFCGKNIYRLGRCATGSFYVSVDRNIPGAGVSFYQFRHS